MFTTGECGWLTVTVVVKDFSDGIALALSQSLYISVSETLEDDEF